MSTNSAAPPTMRVSLRVLGESVTVEAPQSDGMIRLDEALPFLRALDDRAIDVAVRQAEGRGAKVSCRAGCAACCKAQPVPVTPPEAYALWRLVEGLPEERRAEIRRRFADRVERLRGAGLDKAYLERDPTLTRQRARGVAERYFQLGLVCPFLENDRCSIYAERPFVCRQYLVTSPAALCDDPLHNPVQPVAMPVAAASATLEAAARVLGAEQYTVPLVLALEYAETCQRELGQAFPAKEVFARWLEALARGADADADET
jgi:Fe-S-cluster containining protein